MGRSLAREKEKDAGKKNVQKFVVQLVEVDLDERFEAPFRLSQSSTLGSIASFVARGFKKTARKVVLCCA